MREAGEFDTVIRGAPVALDCGASRHDGGSPLMAPPLRRGDGRNMLRPYKNYPCEGAIGGLFALQSLA